MRLRRNARVFMPRTTKSLACLLQTNNPSARSFALGQAEICCASHRRDDVIRKLVTLEIYKLRFSEAK